jgi:hypothetical protein
LGRESQKYSIVRGQRTNYEEITPRSVRDALWVVQYGLDDNRVIDGAYHRQIILDELMMAKGGDETQSDLLHLFIARPIKYRWQGPLPTSWPDLEDLKTEMAFDGSYRCEIDKIEIINKLIRDNAISEEKRQKYYLVEPHPIEPLEPRSFFEYIFEDVEMFKNAREQANRIFKDVL